jgi:hypothetical protein
LWFCVYYYLNKERESVQFGELGMGTTALQDGSLPVPGAFFLVRCPLVPPQVDSRQSSCSAWEQGVSNVCREHHLSADGPLKAMGALGCGWRCPWSPERMLM